MRLNIKSALCARLARFEVDHHVATRVRRAVVLDRDAFVAMVDGQCVRHRSRIDRDRFDRSGPRWAAGSSARASPYAASYHSLQIFGTLAWARICFVFGRNTPLPPV